MAEIDKEKLELGAKEAVEQPLRRKPRKQVAGEDLLSAAEKQDIAKRAREQVVKERKDKASKALLEALKKDVAAEDDPAEEEIDYTIILPYFGGKKGHIYSFVSIDGVRFYHNSTYTFSRKQLDSVRDIVQNAWKHEEAAFGARDPNAFIRQRNQTVGPSTTIQFDNFMRA